MKKNLHSGEAMKELLNPSKKSNDRLWNKKNLEDLKLIEEKKKKNKEQKEIENEILHKNDKYKLRIKNKSNYTDSNLSTYTQDKICQTDSNISDDIKPINPFNNNKKFIYINPVINSCRIEKKEKIENILYNKSNDDIRRINNNYNNLMNIWKNRYGKRAQLYKKLNHQFDFDNYKRNNINNNPTVKRRK